MFGPCSSFIHYRVFPFGDILAYDARGIILIYGRVVDKPVGPPPKETAIAHAFRRAHPRDRSLSSLSAEISLPHLAVPAGLPRIIARPAGRGILVDVKMDLIDKFMNDPEAQEILVELFNLALGHLPANSN